MPPNRFESEVESFLEGSHGDRTHIKRADHPRLHHYAGRYSGTSGLQGAPTALALREKLAQHGAFTGSPAKNFARRDPSSGVFAKKLAQHATNRRFWAIFRALGELFRAHAHHQTEQGELFRAQDTATW